MKKLVALLAVSSSLLFFSAKAQMLPEINLVDMNGSSFSTSQINAQKDSVVVLCFWASWCVPCLNELSAIHEEYADWKKELKFNLYAISTDDSRTDKRVKPLANGKGWGFNVLLDKNQDLKRELNVANIPFTVIIKNGKVLYRHAGYVAGDETVIKKIITENQ